MPLLIVTCEETQLSQRYLLQGERFTIGRSDANAVCLRDRSVSKMHLAVSRVADGWAFQDLLSSNGTFVNEERLESGVLRDGDVIRLGRIKISFVAEPASLSAGAVPGASIVGSALSDTTLSGDIVSGDTVSGDTIPRGTIPGGAIPGEAGPGPFALDRGYPWRRTAAVIGLGLLGIGLGLGAGHIGALFSGSRGGSTEARSPDATSTAAGPVAAGPAPSAASQASTSSTPGGTEGGGTEGGGTEGGGTEQIVPPGGGARAPVHETTAEDWAVGPDLPYLDREESSRVLFRLFLDLLNRPPTRAEANEMMPLSHRERWRRLAGATAAENDLGTLFRRFLDRDPTPVERQALASALAISQAASTPEVEVPDPGLLITASLQYRSGAFRRVRGLTRLAASLIVDLLDRAPDSEEELSEVEAALRADSGSPAAVARVLGFSAEAAGALPAFTPDATGAAVEADIVAGEAAESPAKAALPGDEERAWADSELARFLSRVPTEAEVLATAAELARGPDGARWVRLALAASGAYGGY